ncbi:MAG: DNA-directed RNA polymerase subunit alpha, partial [Terriglobia bacterium]
SSIPGAAITSIKIQDVVHEFTDVPGVKEDISDIVLNLKQVVIGLNGEDTVVVQLEASGPGEAKAKHIKSSSEIEIINPNLHIANLNKGAKLFMEMTVEKGRGYVSAERNKKSSDSIGVIPIDSLFTPVRSVSFDVENTRVGQRTDYDKLVVTVETDGSISAQEAVAQAATVINEHMILFIEQAEVDDEEIFAPEEERTEQTLDEPIEELDLSVRSYNCLKRQGINTLQELVACNEKDLMSVKNFGAKSIQEVKDKLSERDLALQGS